MRRIFPNLVIVNARKQLVARIKFLSFPISIVRDISCPFRDAGIKPVFRDNPAKSGMVGTSAQFCFTTLRGVCIFGIIGAVWMEHHYINKVQERCRVCGRLLVAPNKKSRCSNQCIEFALGILLTTSTHALKFCYWCKHVTRMVYHPILCNRTLTLAYSYVKFNNLCFNNAATMQLHCLNLQHTCIHWILTNISALSMHCRSSRFPSKQSQESFVTLCACDMTGNLAICLSTLQLWKTVLHWPDLPSGCQAQWHQRHYCLIADGSMSIIL